MNSIYPKPNDMNDQFLKLNTADLKAAYGSNSKWLLHRIGDSEIWTVYSTGTVFFLRDGSLVLLHRETAECDGYGERFPRSDDGFILDFHSQAIWMVQLDYDDYGNERKLEEHVEKAVDAAFGGPHIIEYRRRVLTRNVQEAVDWAALRIGQLPEERQGNLQTVLHLFRNGNVQVGLVPRNTKNGGPYEIPQERLFGIQGDKFVGRICLDSPGLHGDMLPDEIEVLVAAAGE